MPTTNLIEQILAPYFRAGYPAIALETAEEQRVIDSIMDYWNANLVFSVSASGGIIDEHNARVINAAGKFSDAFDYLASQNDSFLVVKDFQQIISGSAAYRALLNRLPGIKGNGNMVIMVAPSWNMPAELRREV